MTFWIGRWHGIILKACDDHPIEIPDSILTKFYFELHKPDIDIQTLEHC